MKPLLTAFLLFTACSSDQSKEPNTSGTAHDTDTVNSQGAEAPEPAATPGAEAAESSDAAPSPATSSCVAECIQSRQMQATDIQTIERDCERQCQDEPDES